MNESETTVDLDRALWIAFGALFAGMVAATWLPVEPIVWAFPFWALVTLALMLASAIVAAIAGYGYDWPGDRR